MDFKFELDNLFSRHSLGEVYLFNEMNDDAIWQTKDHDYVTIFVPETMKHRFETFWRSAREKLADRLRIYNVQRGIPFSNGSRMICTLLFISVESAWCLYRHFDEIMTPELYKPWDFESPGQFYQEGMHYGRD